MGFHRDNVIWQSEDHTWNRGFYTCTFTGSPGDSDAVDADYDFLSFEWLATGLASENAAEDSWDGCNPGGYTCYRFTAANASKVRDLEAMASKFSGVLFRAQAAGRAL